MVTCSKDTDRIANSVDPYQTAPYLVVNQEHRFCHDVAQLRG